MAGNRVYTCGVPAAYCCGYTPKVGAMLNSKTRAHDSSSQAFNCHARYLVNECNAVQIGPREFAMDNGEGPVRVLTKKSRFGGMLRAGKRGEGSGGGPVTRYNAKNVHGSTKAGIISSY